MPPGVRQMMPTGSAKMQQPSQIEMPRMPNGPVPSDWQSRITTQKPLPVSAEESLSVTHKRNSMDFSCLRMHTVV